VVQVLEVTLDRPDNLAYGTGRLLHFSAREVAVHSEGVVHLLAASALVAYAACLSHVDGCLLEGCECVVVDMGV
jgi:hypothetical protein